MLKFRVKDIRHASTTKLYTPAGQIKDQHLHLGGQNYVELM